MKKTETELEKALKDENTELEAKNTALEDEKDAAKQDLEKEKTKITELENANGSKTGYILFGITGFISIALCVIIFYQYKKNTAPNHIIEDTNTIDI